mmetsp:Transcript_15468/g.27439  ORF Transcript_15468/g.27439 Transcript_15468/m.27439 type:complete len:113 (+) Transcript_15468:693-1031(+)
MAETGMTGTPATAEGHVRVQHRVMKGTLETAMVRRTRRRSAEMAGTEVEVKMATVVLSQMTVGVAVAVRIPRTLAAAFRIGAVPVGETPRLAALATVLATVQLLVKKMAGVL